MRLLTLGVNFVAFVNRKYKHLFFPNSKKKEKKEQKNVTKLFWNKKGRCS